MNRIDLLGTSSGCRMTGSTGGRTPSPMPRASSRRTSWIVSGGPHRFSVPTSSTLGGAYQPCDARSVAALLETFDADATAAKQALATTADPNATGLWRLKMNGKVSGSYGPTADEP